MRCATFFDLFFSTFLTVQRVGNSLFLDWKIINKGQKSLDSTFIAIFSDPDLGNASDDFIGSHPLKNLAYCYNGDSVDEGSPGYGNNPPVVGFKILDAPGPFATSDGFDNNLNGQIDEPGEKKIVNGFAFHETNNPGQNPPQYSNIRNLLRTRRISGVPFSYGGIGFAPVSPNNPATNFMFPGDSDPIGYGLGGTVQNPISMAPWSEITENNLPGDRRFVLTSGPFKFRPGESIRYQYAVLVGHGGNHLQNINNLFSVSDSLDLLRPLLTSSLPLLPQSPEDIRLYPNPTAGELYFLSKNPVEEYALFDARGRPVKTERLSSTNQFINLKNMPAGIYFLKLVQGGKVIFRKVVKE